MKKLFIVVAVAVFGLTACKKDWTCACSNSVSVQAGAKIKKSDAKTWCEAIQTTQNIMGSGVSCDLK